VSDEPPKRPDPPEDFTIGEWLVEPSLDRLSRADSVVHLRPQLTDLLLLLARHAGRTVPKHVILDEVWARQYVGESALTRCIAEIRQALGDDARQPTIIETIPKRGYRLVAPVVFLPGGDAPANGGNGQGRVEVATVRSLTADEPSITANASAGDAQEASALDAPGSAGSAANAGAILHKLRWEILFATVAVAAVLTLAGSRCGTRPLPAQHKTVMLADVTNSTRERVFDDTLRLALAGQLEQAPLLRILPQNVVRLALVRAGHAPDERVVGPLALELCRREDAAVLVAGSLAPLGSRYTVGIEAIACATAESLGRAVEEADSKEHVLAALERAATRIRVRLDGSRALLGQPVVPLALTTTPQHELLARRRDPGARSDDVPRRRARTEP
jgi:DNA-binding winged helix-turn-helix (wHTH) protein